MKTEEKRLGRIFRVTLEAGDRFHANLTRFVKEKNVRAGSVFLIGALSETKMFSGFRSMDGYDVDRLRLEGWRELVALGNITWPAEAPAALGDERWEAPQPYVHVHMAISGGPGEPEKVLAGHLSDGVVKGGMIVEIYEHLDAAPGA